MLISLDMVKIPIKENKKKSLRKKKDRSERRKVIFVEDTDNEREEGIKKIENVEKTIRIETGLLQQISRLE